MPETVIIGTINRELYTNFILWSDGHGRHYAYEGASGKITIGLYPVLIDGQDKAQNRFYQLTIKFPDSRPAIDRLVKYYFIVKTCRQNHIDFDRVIWSRRNATPSTIRKPAPRKGPEKTNTWYLVVFEYQDLFKPVLTRSVDRAWHSEYADSPVPLSFVGATEYSPELFDMLMQTLEESRDHGNWFTYNGASRATLTALDLTSEIV